MTPVPANLNRPAATRPAATPATLQATYAAHLAGANPRDQVRLLTGSLRAPRSAPPTRAGLGAAKPPSPLPRTRACA